MAYGLKASSCDPLRIAEVVKLCVSRALPRTINEKKHQQKKKKKKKKKKLTSFKFINVTIIITK